MADPTPTQRPTSQPATAGPASRDEGPTTRQRELRSLPALGAAFRAGRVHLLVGLALGLVAGLAVAWLSPTTYQATATVRVGSGLVPVGDFRPDTLWAEDQVALARTTPVREAIAERVGGGVDADDVASRLGVTAETNSNYLVFTWTASSASDAESGADAAALTYLEQARDEAEQRWQGHDNLLVSLIEQLGPDDPRAKELVEQRITLEETIVDPGKVAGQAAGSARRTSLSPPAHVLAGSLGGLVLGAVSAYLWYVRRGSLVTAPVGVPFVAAGGPRPDPGMPVLGEVSKDGTDGSLAPLGRNLVTWVLRREQGRSRDAARLGIHVTPDAPEGAASVVRRALRAAGVDGRVEAEEVDTSLPSWRQEYESLDAVVVVSGDDAWGDESVTLARLHLETLDVEVLGLVRVGGAERG